MSSTQPNTAKSSSKSAALTPRTAARLLSDLVLTDAKNLGAFRRKWDRLYRDYADEALLNIADELRLLWWHVAPSHPQFFRIENLFQQTTRTEHVEKDYEWSASPDRGISLPQFLCDKWLRMEKNGIVIHWRSRQIKARPTSLPTVLAVSCLHHWPYLRICINSQCRNRYFIAGRRDQKYCSPECAEPAKLAAKLKWWHENRGRNKKGGA